MTTSLKTVLTAETLGREECPATEVLDPTDEVFFEAFCELLDIEERRYGDPIIVLPTGPVTFH